MLARRFQPFMRTPRFPSTPIIFSASNCTGNKKHESSGTDIRKVDSHFSIILQRLCLTSTWNAFVTWLRYQELERFHRLYVMRLRSFRKYFMRSNPIATRGRAGSYTYSDSTFVGGSRAFHLLGHQHLAFHLVHYFYEPVTEETNILAWMFDSMYATCLTAILGNLNQSSQTSWWTATLKNSRTRSLSAKVFQR